MPLHKALAEMVISALAKTGKAHLVERLDLRIPLAEVKLAEQKKLSRSIDEYDKLPASDFIIVGALTELNYNIVSGGAQLYVKGIGGGARTGLLLTLRWTCGSLTLAILRSDTCHPCRNKSLGMKLIQTYSVSSAALLSNSMPAQFATSHYSLVCDL